MQLDHVAGSRDGSDKAEKTRIACLKISDSGSDGSGCVSDLHPEPVFDYVDRALALRWWRGWRVINHYQPTPDKVVHSEGIALRVPGQAANGVTKCIAKPRVLSGSSTLGCRTGGGRRTRIRLRKRLGPLRFRSWENPGTVLHGDTKVGQAPNLLHAPAILWLARAPIPIVRVNALLMPTDCSGIHVPEGIRQIPHLFGYSFRINRQTHTPFRVADTKTTRSAPAVGAVAQGRRDMDNGYEETPDGSNGNRLNELLSCSTGPLSSTRHPFAGRSSEIGSCILSERRQKHVTPARQPCKVYGVFFWLPAGAVTGRAMRDGKSSRRAARA
jgi:hypothetical protein